MLCLGLVGCGAGQVNIPKKTAPIAEANEAYDVEKFAKINIPSNCKAVGIAKHGNILIENGSGTQFIVKVSGEIFDAPAKIVPDMPELW